MKKEIEEKRGDLKAVRLWVQDETRVGLLPIRRRRITKRGVRPLVGAEQKREYEYLFGLIEPLTGADFMMELPSLETVTMQVFMDEFGREDTGSLHLIVLDQASAHTTSKLRVAENIVLIFLPANAPELNPIERFWKELKDWLSDYEPQTMMEVSELLKRGLESFSKAALRSLTSFEYLIKAWQAAIA